MKDKWMYAYMDIALRIAQLSYAKRAKVGAIIVKDHMILSCGYNGTPAGWDNNCEHKEYCLSKDFNGNYFPGTEGEYPLEDRLGRYRLKTKPEVIHAERNALDKLSKTTGGGEGASLFVTHSPCIECAKSIHTAGISMVYYKEPHKASGGLEFLHKSGVNTTRVLYHDDD